jgi:hypothetical protein
MSGSLCLGGFRTVVSVPNAAISTRGAGPTSESLCSRVSVRVSVPRAERGRALREEAAAVVPGSSVSPVSAGVSKNCERNGSSGCPSAMRVSPLVGSKGELGYRFLRGHARIPLTSTPIYHFVYSGKALWSQVRFWERGDSGVPQVCLLHRANCGSGVAFRRQRTTRSRRNVIGSNEMNSPRPQRAVRPGDQWPIGPLSRPSPCVRRWRALDRSPPRTPCGLARVPAADRRGERRT